MQQLISSTVTANAMQTAAPASTPQRVTTHTAAHPLLLVFSHLLTSTFNCNCQDNRSARSLLRPSPIADVFQQQQAVR